MAKHYVNNKEFLAAIIEYRGKVKDAEEEGKPKPRVSNYIGECILKIATHLSYKPNFIGYSYREEMISDGIENCLQYIDNFDPSKSSNPFAYFTQIIYYAFIRRISKEKKQSYVKHQLVRDLPFDAFDTLEGDDTQYSHAFLEFLQQNNAYDDSFMVLKEKKKKAAKASELPLDKFMEE